MFRFRPWMLTVPVVAVTTLGCGDKSGADKGADAKPAADGKAAADGNAAADDAKAGDEGEPGSGSKSDDGEAAGSGGSDGGSGGSGGSGAAAGSDGATTGSPAAAGSSGGTGDGDGDGDDDGAAEDGGGSGGEPAADTKALTKEIKNKRTKDDRALEALAELEAAGAKIRDVAKAANARGVALHATPDRAKTFFEWALEKDEKYPDPAFNLAKQTVNTGEVAETVKWLTEVKKRKGKKLLQQIEFDPMWEIVKDDPDVKALLRK